jgi:hypothetical protein
MIHLGHLAEDHFKYHSEFQMDYFITGRSGGTPYGQYKQALRELFSRADALRDEFAEKQKMDIELESMQKWLNSPFLFGKRKKFKQIEYERLKLKQWQLGDTIKHRAREMCRFYAQAMTLRKDLGIPVGGLSEERRRELENEHWLFIIKRQAAFDIMCTGQVKQNTMESICSLPAGPRQEIINFISQDDKDMISGWAMCLKPFDLPLELPDASLDEVKRLVNADYHC